MAEEFRAEKLGDLFRPISKSYAGLIAHLVAPSRPDIRLMNEIYASFEGQKDRASFAKHMKWMAKERINLFRPELFRKFPDEIEVPPQYFSSFAKEFSLGSLMWPPPFEYSRILLKDERRKKIKKMLRLDVVPFPEGDFSSNGGGEKKSGISFFSVSPDSHRFLTRTEIAILAHISFKTGATLHAKLTPNDITFKTMVKFAEIADAQWRMPIEYSLVIHSHGVLTSAADYEGRKVKIPGKSIQKELADYITKNDEKMKIITELANALKRLEKNQFVISITYTPPGLVSRKGTLILSAHYTPIISKYSPSKINQKWKNRTLEWLYEDRLVGFLQPVIVGMAKQIVEELNPDIFFTYLKEKGLFGTERGWLTRR